MTGNKLLMLDIPAFLDMETASPIVRMRNSYEKRFLERFERNAAVQRGSRGPLSNIFEFIADRMEQKKEPKLLTGALAFLNALTNVQNPRGVGHVMVFAGASDPTMVKGKEFYHAHFNPYTRAFQDALPENMRIHITTFANLGLDERKTSGIDEVGAYLRRAINSEEIRREDVMIVTANEARAEKARTLGYQAVYIKDGGYADALARVKAFFPLPPETGARPAPEL